VVEWGIVYGIGEQTTNEKTVIETALRLKLRNLARNDFLGSRETNRFHG
jgi:hypothetical protein